MTETDGEKGCALCGGHLRPVFTVHGYDVCECERCAHRQLDAAALPDSSTHVAAMYGDGYFSGGGAGYPDYLAEGPMLRARGKRYGAILRRFAPAGVAVLDVGAAAGFVLAGLEDSGWKGTGIEPNDRMAAHGRDVLGVDVRTGTLEDAPVEGPFDAISLIQVIAHFVDPVAAVRVAASKLAPGGVLLIETWDRASLTARVFGRRWHEYSPPSVVHWFTRSELDVLARMAGLEPVADGRMVKWIGGAHAKSLVAHRSALLGRLARVVPSRIRIPYPSEDLEWKLYRKP